MKNKYRQIIRNKDNKGNILTYSVFTEGGYEMEFNTLREARIMAVKIE